MMGSFYNVSEQARRSQRWISVVNRSKGAGGMGHGAMGDKLGREGGGGRGKRTCMMSVRTLGTSEKKKSANTPATRPNDPAVVALCLEREPSARRISGKKRVWEF